MKIVKKRREIPFDIFKVKKSSITKNSNNTYKVTDILENDIVRKIVFNKNGKVNSVEIYMHPSIKNIVFKIQYNKDGTIKSQWKNVRLLNVLLSRYKDLNKFHVL